MGIIFWLSAQDADESSEQSSAVLLWLIEHFGENIFTVFIVRKLAHFLEYTGLSLLFNISLYQTRKKKTLVIATLLASLYAVSDEIHQLFVDGRSCQISDWAIDTAGAILGTIVFLIIFTVIYKIISKKNTVDRSAN